MRLYVSGPITGVKNYRDRFRQARLALQRAGYEVEDPSTYGFDEASPWAECMKYDIKKMLDCDGVALLDNWEASAGAQIERRLARDLSMPVLPVEDWHTKKL